MVKNRFFSLLKKNKDNFAVLLIIFILVVGISFNVFITSGDELWTFQNTYKLYNGYEIYKDANVICTPLFFYLGKVLFELFGANFFIYRVYNLFIDITLFAFTYIFCKKLGISKKGSLLTVLLLIIMGNYSIILCMANYNVLGLLLYLIGLIFALKPNKDVKYYITQGIIAFLVFFTKQNMGFYYILSMVIVEIVSNSNLKLKIKNIFIEFLAFIIPFIIFILFLFINGNLNGFIDYAVLGINEFGKANINIEYLSLCVYIFIMLFNITVSVVFLRSRNDVIPNRRNFITVNIFAFFLTFALFPILNKPHLCISMYIEIIVFIYILKILKDILIRNKGIYNKIKNSILIISILFMLYISVFSLLNWFKIVTSNMYKFSFEDPYYGVIIRNEDYNKIENVTRYISESNNRVIVLSSDAAMYMVPLKVSNGKMDLPFKGNLGKQGEEGLLNDIKKMKNTEILIKRDEGKVNWQESKLVREYIINNMEYIGEIEDFSIYATTVDI